MKITCIAIDDEPLALELMEAHIQKIPYLRLVGKFYNPVKALEVLKTMQVDLLYLDINMPDVMGIDFLKSFATPPKVIFVTAYDQFAVQGFEVNAADYLLKPVSFTRFLSATDKVYEQLKDKKQNTYIFVKSEHNILKVELDTIHYIEGYKDYLKIHTHDSKPTLTITTFKAIEEILPSEFIRVHKSYIVSIDKIKSLRNGKILLKDKHIPIGDSYRESFQKKVVDGRL